MELYIHYKTYSASPGDSWIGWGLHPTQLTGMRPSQAFATSRMRLMQRDSQWKREESPQPTWP